MEPAQQKKSSAASKKLRKEHLPHDEMWNILNNVGSAGDAVAAVMGVSYLDHALELLLKARFIELDKDDYQKVFTSSGGGILESFVAKVRTAYALDLLCPKTYHDLLLISEIRNVFAQGLDPRTAAMGSGSSPSPLPRS